MEITWKEYKYHPAVQYIATPVNIPSARFTSEEVAPTVQQYKKTRLDSKGLTTVEEQKRKISKLYFCLLILAGHSLRDIAVKLGAMYPFDVTFTNPH